MPLVHVIHRGLQSQFLQSAQTADSKHDFLADALVTIAAVKLVGDLAMIGALGFCGMLLSSRYSFTRPTSIRQTFRNTCVRRRASQLTSSSLPSARVTGVTGSE